MNIEDRLVEVMAELPAEVHDIKNELKGLRGDVVKLQELQAKTDIGISELRLSVMKLADEKATSRDHEKRIRKIEMRVFKKL